jgi:hypothetical protein
MSGELRRMALHLETAAVLEVRARDGRPAAGGRPAAARRAAPPEAARLRERLAA